MEERAKWPPLWLSWVQNIFFFFLEDLKCCCTASEKLQTLLAAHASFLFTLFRWEWLSMCFNNLFIKKEYFKIPHDFKFTQTVFVFKLILKHESSFSNNLKHHPYAKISFPTNCLSNYNKHSRRSINLYVRTTVMGSACRIYGERHILSPFFLHNIMLFPWIVSSFCTQIKLCSFFFSSWCRGHLSFWRLLNLRAELRTLLWFCFLCPLHACTLRIETIYAVH